MKAEGFQPTETKDDAEALESDFIYRHHVEPRVQLCVPREETLPIPLKYIDVTRATETILDVLQEKRIDDQFVRFMERIHDVHSIERENSRGTFVVREAADTNSSNFQTSLFVA